jgi:hypothetical protein
MKRLISIKELRNLLSGSSDIYEICDVINAKAQVYAFNETKAVIESAANTAARKLRHRVEVTKKLKSQSKTYIKI